MSEPTTQTYAVFETTHGFCGIAWSGRGVTRLTLPTRDRAAAERLIRRRAVAAVPGAPDPDIAAAIAAIERYFAGAQTDFAGVALDLGDQDALLARIYDATRKVGWGATTTYGALAKAIGAGPEAARDVGLAMARNPAPPVIPCHRVLAAGGKPGGFSAPGGVAAKIRMLELEGVTLAPPPPVQRAFAF